MGSKTQLSPPRVTGKPADSVVSYSPLLWGSSNCALSSPPQVQLLQTAGHHIPHGNFLIL